MDNLIHIVRSEMMDWENEVIHANRHSVFSEHILLANKIRQHQHIKSRPTVHDSAPTHDSTSATTPETHLVVLDDRDVLPTTPTVVAGAGPNIKTPPASWTWLPAVTPRGGSVEVTPRVSTTCRRPGRHPFSSLDSTVAGVMSSPSSMPSLSHSPSSSVSSTSPSVVISVMTEATSILDEHFYYESDYPSFDLDLRDPRLLDGKFSHNANDRPYTGSPRSFSRLRPRVALRRPTTASRPGTPCTIQGDMNSAHNGLRSLLKRLLPRLWARSHSRRGHVHPQAVSSDDAVSLVSNSDSIQHHRLSIASATQEAIDAVEAHGVGIAVADEAESIIEALPQIGEHTTVSMYWSNTPPPTPRRRLQKAAPTNSWIKLMDGGVVETDDSRFSHHCVC